MLEQAFTRPWAIRRYRESLFGPHLDDYVAFLVGERYPRTTVHTKINRVNALGKWLVRKGVRIEHLQRSHVEAFLADWRREGRFYPGDKGTVFGFLDHLRAKGVVAEDSAPPEQGARNKIEREYETYLAAERGLCAGTIENYLYFVRQFLGDGGPTAAQQKIATMDRRSINSFMLDYLHASNRSRAKNMGKVLRSFLRFLFLTGHVREDLSDSVPKVQTARLATIPKYITLEEVERAVASCDLSTPTGRRDRAILLLLARVGLRAGEVASLRLDDIDWAAAELVIHGKGQRRHRLPLLHDVGRALADYIRHDRPRCESRRVFIRRKAPFRGLRSAAAVSDIARRALTRAKIHSPAGSAHVFRHSLATGLLHRGASLAEVGEVLRHEKIQTTELYAKVDLNGLRALTRPWPVAGGPQ